jgi:Spondin_N
MLLRAIRPKSNVWCLHITTFLRFTGMHDYPLCQNASWVPEVAMDLYLMDAGIMDGTTWVALGAQWTDPPGVIEIVGRGTQAWNMELCGAGA